MNNELIKINDNGLVSARDLHEFLGLSKRFSAWFETYSKNEDYGFTENEDYTSVLSSTVVNNGAERQLQDYAITIDMAKELSMLSKTEKGKQARKYFIQVEKAWNTPEMIMKRALEIASKQVENLKLENAEKTKTIEEQKPKVIFADAVATSKTSILVGELAKILKQNGVDTGQKRLFSWMRENGYLIKRKGNDYNMPTQKSMELGLFEIKESSHLNSNGVNITTKTPKVTGKGQRYFINKFLNEED
ncbi:phage antirepressor KilAC domain-containing protein [uncultured Clostridium sp.]|uniref:phage antirepressor KilAC domain-containing protein n=1 Tax=uncultured Clostridium sp. TaxID=59620 RepID=UPI0025F4BFC2|nr:phage antirepressor KilAC domain-containing protein [uncultured Clostridium sp.]